jgi:HAD superfamily hydrolase (TIGR01509 family)
VKERLAVSPNARGLIFDCDGTLADTMPIHWQAWHEEMARYGLTCPQSFLETHKGAHVPDIVRQYNQAFGTRLDPVQFAADKEWRSFQKIPEVRPIAPVVELVYLSRGKYPMAVVSGGNRRNVELTLRVLGLGDDFITVITADDGFPAKPEPDMFLEAARRIGVSPEFCQVFEDGDFGIEAACRAGMIATDIRPFLSGDGGIVQNRR